MHRPFVDWLDALRSWAANATNAELVEAVSALAKEFDARGVPFVWLAHLVGPPAPAKVK